MAEEQSELKVIISALTTGFEAGMKRVGLALKSLSLSSGAAFGAIGSVAQRTSGMATSMGAKMAQVSSAMAQNFKARMDEMVAKAKEVAKVVGIAFAATGAIVAKTGVQYNAQLEQSEMAWTTLLKSQQAGQKMMADLQKMGKYTPFETEELDSSAKLLKAMGFEARDILPTLNTIGDATSAIGGNGETLNNIARALGQMRTKGKISAEEIYENWSRLSVMAA